MKVLTDATERALLGSLLRFPSELDEVADVVRADHFRGGAESGNGRLFRVLLDLNGRSPVDLVAAAEELNRRGWLADVGGPPYLASLWDNQPTGAHARHFAEAVLDAHIRRALGGLGRSMLLESEKPTGGAMEALESAERELWSLSELGSQGQVADIDATVSEVFDRIDARSGGGSRGLPTGFESLDEILVGLQPGELTILAARPSVGKTAMGVSIARNLALGAGAAVFFASLEQSRVELVERMIAGEAGVDSQLVRRGMLGKLEIRRLHEAGNRLRVAPVFFDDCARQSCQRIAANARRLVRRADVKAVIVDYLQLIEPEDRRVSRHEQVGGISRRLKGLARELGLPVVALAQLNRAADERRPRLSDLRESGSIEADADTVILLHRPENAKGAVIPVEVIVAKQRNGPTGELILSYNRPMVRFEEGVAPQPFAL
jgi:replicative DNA helicase